MCSADSLEGELQIGSSLFWACSKSEGSVFSFVLPPIHCVLTLIREIFAEIPISVPALRGHGQAKAYPLPPQERFMVSGGTDGWAQADEDSWYFFLSEIALRRITDKAADAVGTFFDDIVRMPEQRQSAAVEEFIPISLELERQAHAWREHLPPSLRFAYEAIPRPADTEWKLHLRAPYYRVLELIYRPFIYAAIHHSAPSAIVRALASKGLDNACTYLLHGHPTLRHHGRWLQMRYEIKATCLLLAASKSDVEMPQGWYDAVQVSNRSLRYWAWEAPFCRSYIHLVHTLEKYMETQDNRTTTQFGQTPETSLQNHIGEGDDTQMG